ncbi:MAG TPA: twin-arginine translocase TatA/TatE family subunit [Microbacteriaceae bacterium]|nr:twin-arginine translocase TatA/TatE family subunit [Microbacteriaceae bacterium]
MFGLTFEKLLVIGVIAAFIIGPERLPGAARRLGTLIRQVRGFAQGASARVREEMGPDFDEVDWKRLDPRQFDPRTIVRDVLQDDATNAAGPTRTPRSTPLERGAVAPFDPDAT